MIKSNMDNLPTPPTGGTNNGNSDSPTSQPTATIGAGSGAKEKESGAFAFAEKQGLREMGQELDLPPEVSGAGVKVHSTTVAIPPSVATLGVKPVGPVPSGQPTMSLPLTDDQIAQGLTQGVTSSWRWLAEWCRRRLKQFRRAVQDIHGKVTPIKL